MEFGNCMKRIKKCAGIRKTKTKVNEFLWSEKRKETQENWK